MFGWITGMKRGAAGATISGQALLARFALLAVISAVVGLLTNKVWGLNQQQTISVTVFLIIILSTLFFWNFRLAVAFLGLPVLLFTGALEMECFKDHCSLKVMQKIFLSSFSLLLIRSMGRFIGKVLHHFALDHLCLLRVGIELELEPGHALVGEKDLCQNVFLRMIF